MYKEVVVMRKEQEQLKITLTNYQQCDKNVRWEQRYEDRSKQSKPFYKRMMMMMMMMMMKSINLIVKLLWSL